MFSIVSLAIVVTMFGIAFPPLLIVAAALWFIIFRTVRRRMRAAQEAHLTKVLRTEQRRYDKAVRFFQ